MNKVEIIGRLARDPQVSVSAGETPITIARITVAVNRRYKKDDQPTADFISCVAFGKSAEVLAEHFKKGKEIALCGEIRTGSYTDKEGQTKYTTDVIVNEWEFVGSKGTDAAAPAAEATAAPAAAAPAPATAPVGEDFMSLPEGFEDEFPFV